MIIIGIDPGTIRMGYALIKAVSTKSVSVLTMGYIDLSDARSHPEKLKTIYEEIQHLIRHYQPSAMAIESPFYGKNVQSMLKLGRSQGVAMAVAFAHQVSVTEYAPKEIKLSITGNGNASKEQVSRMLHTLLCFNYSDKKMDATDALAVALCHWFHLNTLWKKDNLVQHTKTRSSKKNSWKKFLDTHPERTLK